MLSPTLQLDLDPSNDRSNLDCGHLFLDVRVIETGILCELAVSICPSTPCHSESVSGVKSFNSVRRKAVIRERQHMAQTGYSRFSDERLLSLLKSLSAKKTVDLG
jgi:hypothetical protein